MTTPHARALQVLADLFDEDAPEDETPEAIAALVLDRLLEHGLVLAPVEPTKEIKVVLRRAVYEKTRGAEDIPTNRTPTKVWAAILQTLTGD